MPPCLEEGCLIAAIFFRVTSTVLIVWVSITRAAMFGTVFAWAAWVSRIFLTWAAELFIQGRNAKLIVASVLSFATLLFWIAEAIRICPPSVVLTALNTTLAWAIRIFRPFDTFTAFFSTLFFFASAMWVVIMVVTILWAAS